MVIRVVVVVISEIYLALAQLQSSEPWRFLTSFQLCLQKEEKS